MEPASPASTTKVPPEGRARQLPTRGPKPRSPRWSTTADVCGKAGSTASAESAPDRRRTATGPWCTAPLRRSAPRHKPAARPATNTSAADGTSETCLRPSTDPRLSVLPPPRALPADGPRPRPCADSGRGESPAASRRYRRTRFHSDRRHTRAGHRTSEAVPNPTARDPAETGPIPRLEATHGPAGPPR